MDGTQRPAGFAQVITFSGSRAGWPLEPTEALKRDVTTFQNTFINLSLVLQASEIPRSPIRFPLHCMEVGRIYTTNKVILKEGEKREGKKRIGVGILNIFLKSTLPVEDKKYTSRHPNQALSFLKSILIEIRVSTDKARPWVPECPGVLSKQQSALIMTAAFVP